MWILLEEGMTIDYRDEVLDADSLSWESISDEFCGFGEPYRNYRFPMRRKINTMEAQAKCLCDTCQNVGCRGVEIPFRGKWTMHECEGYSAPETFEREEV